MSTRRDFLRHAGAAGLLSTVAVSVAQAVDAVSVTPNTSAPNGGALGPGVVHTKTLRHLADVAPELERILTTGDLAPPIFQPSEIKRQTVSVGMRDGIHLATDLYLPPGDRGPAIAMRTPYGRASNADSFLPFAQRGYVVISQDCRGTGDSEPSTWDFGIYEHEDSLDFVEWITHQEWFDGFLGAFGGSYEGGLEWDMAMHPRMSTIVPQVAGLVDAAPSSGRLYMHLNAYSRDEGKGPDKVSTPLPELERQMLGETLAGGYFNEPLHKAFPDNLLEQYPQLRSLPASKRKQWLWERYTTLGPAQRAELIKLAAGESSITFSSMEALDSIFPRDVSRGYPSIASEGVSKLAQSLKAPALIIDGWYDWTLGNALATWDLITREAPKSVSSRCRLIFPPTAHAGPGYHEDKAHHPELERNYYGAETVDLLLYWYRAVRNNSVDSWPLATYYLMGANEWCAASAWPPPETKTCALYIGAGGTLTSKAPSETTQPDRYTYDPDDPTPTVGGSIVSYVYPAGSVDVSATQKRADVLTYTTGRLDRDLDVVGPLRFVLYTSSSALETDFVARLSDVFPDGRAIQLQNGMLRTRYRDPRGEPQLLKPGSIYRLEIDMWATANRFKAGHRLRVDISSADFPKFDRNANRGGEPGAPVRAVQTIYHDPKHPSHLLLSTAGPIDDL